MAYKALYRKYRPLFFDEVTGQDSIIKTLQNSIKVNKISHAYLFTGTRGTGKTSIAKIFAKTVNCLDMNDGKPCGICDICKNTNTDEIQDIIEIDAASNNGVDEIREIKSKVNLVPTICKYKVYIIDEVHMLSIGAFNALLKTLEEPPMHAIFILATTEPQKLPGTIISRCQRYDFKKLSVESIKKRLQFIVEQEKIKIDTECLNEIAKLGDGSMRDAIGLLEQVSAYVDKEISVQDIYELSGNVSGTQIANIIELFLTKNIENLLDFSESLYEEGKDFEKLVESLIFFLRNVLICKNAPKYFDKKHIYNKDLIVDISKKITDIFLLNTIKETAILLVDIKKSSHPNILFELFLFKIVSKEEQTEFKLENEIKKEISYESEKPILKIDVVKNEFTNEIKLDFLKEKPIVVTEYKKALINNTIALSQKDELKNMQENWKKLQTYLINKKYKEVATILLDSKINAVGKNHILLTYKYDSMVECHDKEALKIENLLYDMTETKYKVVAITEDNWNELRPYYLELKKKNNKIDLLEENEVEENLKEEKKELNPLVDSAINVFGEDLIEMEG